MISFEQSAEGRMAAETLLLVDDDTQLTGLISQYLENNGYQVEVENDGSQAIERIQRIKPDLIVLDLLLPGSDGLAICQSIRDDFPGPIIMLTALDDEIDEVTGLELGADDYLSKPIKPRVLLAHIRSQLRRYGRKKDDVEMQVLAADGDLIVDQGRRQARYKGNVLDLSSAEFDLLWLLAENKGRAMSRESLYQSLFRLEYDGLDRSVDLRISRIRKKMSVHSASVIVTVRNSGYQLIE
ncbi:response regulator transcription factor [Pseudoteredinibacter isoporae]|uniref:Two-component system response regulator RstA n=1 Tax=Pseudoteredinibacter isoporae TaxID=570281 RepID=A0A7X0MUI2_9GAMM|nr:response regulator transcription factor [Pseudoteredinibacter isoporae]MBB6520050.1 two-component system response regulator RstA [Pseudoteredinibacter isoporae]